MVRPDFNKKYLTGTKSAGRTLRSLFTLIRLLYWRMKFRTWLDVHRNRKKGCVYFALTIWCTNRAITRGSHMVANFPLSKPEIVCYYFVFLPLRTLYRNTHAQTAICRRTSTHTHTHSHSRNLKFTIQNNMCTNAATPQVSVWRLMCHTELRIFFSGLLSLFRWTRNLRLRSGILDITI